jgi:hypothetical protein
MIRITAVLDTRHFKLLQNVVHLISAKFHNAKKM